MLTPPTPTTKRSTNNLDAEAHRKAVATTLASMEDVASTAQLTYFSNRSIAEVEALQEEVSAVIPAGNIVGLVMGGLIRLRDRSLPAHQAKSDVSALLRGLEMLPRNILPGTLYGTLFVGPAAVLAAYQKLLTLTGKDPDSAFPNGLWQFYLEFALREDSARHTNETIGFHEALTSYDLDLSPIDQLAAWVCAVSQIYFQYDDLLYNQWRERVYLHLLEQVVAEANLDHRISFQRLSHAWMVQRPYHRGPGASQDENFSLYRRRRFDNFLQSRLSLLPDKYREKVEVAYARQAEQELLAYQNQMSILATLDPERYRENRTHIPLWQARIGVVLQQRYYLLPACHMDLMGHPLLFETREGDSQFHPLEPGPDRNLYDPAGHPVSVDRTGRACKSGEERPCGYLRPAYFQTVRRQVAAIFEHAAQAEAAPLLGLDDQLIRIKRAEQERARRALSAEAVQQELQSLKCAPVIINWDEEDVSKPLAYIRQGKRGIGDHALTIFRASNSIIFDQSHIFFDGTWGMAVAEILTGEAISWAAYFSRLTTPEPTKTVPYSLTLAAEPALEEFPRVVVTEVSAESTGLDLRTLYMLRTLLPKRHPDLKLTVNDMLILFRCEFGHEYRPSSELEDALFEFRAQNTPEAREIYDLINSILAKAQASNPSLMIPMDATAARPKERLYPTTFRNPFSDLWANYRTSSQALNAYVDNQTQEHWIHFTSARRSLQAQLNYFGQLMRAYKKVALEGGSTSTATIRLLAHLPDSFLSLLDQIPRRVDILNEVLKGEEVFSNFGRVARESSITRLISAKDDNENKTLVWAVVTDDTDTLHLSLRDFRPHVAALCEFGRVDLAELLARDYLDAFVTGFNQFVRRLIDILNANATHTSKEVTK